jgi:hypothetical protein
MQTGIAAYLRNLAVRCNTVGRQTEDKAVQIALWEMSVELAEKAEVLEEAFRIGKPRRPGHPGIAKT